MSVCAWGTPATATTTITANIIGWTDDPCDYPEHQDKCVAPLIPEFQFKTDAEDILFTVTVEPDEQFPKTISNYE